MPVLLEVVSPSRGLHSDVSQGGLFTSLCVCACVGSVLLFGLIDPLGLVKMLIYLSFCGSDHEHP